MTSRPCKYIFGPVPSRRLGHSLGVDLVPFKTCTYDCIYCQLGRTSVKTLERKEYVPVEAVLSELDLRLAEGVAPDYVTLSGSGEPTLHSQIEELVTGIKRRTRIPLAVLTNGSLLWDPAVRRGLAEADVVIPSLDAGDETFFRYVNRPHSELSFAQVVEGLRAFQREFKGQIWLEVFLLAGITATTSQVEKIAALAKRIRPDRVQLNTVSRPPAEEFAYSVTRHQMEMFARLFDGKSEVISEQTPGGSLHTGPCVTQATDDDILALLGRRPCTAQGVSTGLGLHINEATKRLQHLLEQGAVSTLRKDDTLFYQTKRIT